MPFLCITQVVHHTWTNHVFLWSLLFTFIILYDVIMGLEPAAE